MAPSPLPVVDTDAALSGAFVDVVEALDATLTERFTRFEARLWSRAHVAASVAVLVIIALATTALAWGAASVAIGAFVAARHGLVGAGAVVAAINIAVALGCVVVARSVSSRVPPVSRLTTHE